MRPSRSLALIVAGVLMALSLAGAAQQGRDQPAQRPRAGTGVVAGRVVHGETRQPIADAIVVLAGGETASIRVGQTDGAGQFLLPGVPAGKFAMSASKPPFLGAMNGATRPGRPGTPVVLTEGQIITGLEIRMWPGAVITGTITDDQGEPLPGAEMQVQARGGAARGELAMALAVLGASSRATSDDRGIYRIYGIAPGEYLVVASAPAIAASARRITPADVANGLSALRAAAPPGASPGRAGSTNPTRAGGPPAPSGPVPGRAAAGAAFAPVYFPGTPDLSRAATVTVTAGEERSGVNIRMDYVPLALVEGAIYAADGTPAANVQVTLQRTSGDSLLAMLRATSGARSSVSGQFSIRNAAPGEYRLTARSSVATGVTAPALWAAADVTIAGQDVTGLVLQLQPGLTLSGRIVMNATRLAPPVDFSNVWVAVAPMTALRDPLGNVVAAGGIGPNVRTDGTFEVPGLVPGSYLLTGMFGGDPGDRLAWRLTSVVLDGQEVLDLPFDLPPHAVPKSAIMTFSDVQQGLSGVISDASGQPFTASTVLLFATDRRYWYRESRRVLAVRPGTDGSYDFGGLLGPSAGEYCLSVVTDLDPGQQFDPAFLDALVKASPIRLTLAPGEKKKQDLQIKLATYK